MIAGAAAPPSHATAELSTEALQPAIAAAQAYWNDASLDNVDVRISALAAGWAGATIGATVWIDATGGGQGWIVDSHAGEHSQGLDLLTVLRHEFGHVLGHDDLSEAEASGQIMSGSILPGVHLRPVWELSNLLPGSAELALSPLSSALRDFQAWLLFQLQEELLNLLAKDRGKIR